MYKTLAVALILTVLVDQVTGSSCPIEDAIEAHVTKKVPSDTQALKAELLELRREQAWYSLHVAAAAACRGSTASGGTGPHFNVVFPKQYSISCDAQCGKTDYRECDADVAIHGSFGKATSYTERVGQFYNYGCSDSKHIDAKFDEVKADEDGVFNFDVNLPGRQGKASYYRFCCCRFP